jgi:hypothetical protein
MKYLAIWSNYTEFSENKLFDETIYLIGEDFAYSAILLRNKLMERGYVLETIDMKSTDNYERYIFTDYPDSYPNHIQLDPQKKYLILLECGMISKGNVTINNHKTFHKIFTYDDNLIKNYGYIKLNFPSRLKTPIIKDFKNKKFCTLIVGNKKSNEPGELYSERRKIIRYFEKRHKDLLDFYGIGWENELSLTGRYPMGVYRRIPFIKALFTIHHPCYRGKVEKKLDIMSDYKFCICYENCSIIPGYITEKIFDSFFAGCIPIYLGAPNIEEYIPKNCFIDRRNFPNDKSLLKYLLSIDEKKYNNYIANINNFLKSDAAYQFSADYYVDKIIAELELT